MPEKLIPDFYHTIKTTKKQKEILKNLRKSKTITNFLVLKTKPPEESNTRRNYAGFIRDYFVELDILNIEEYFQDLRLIENGKRVKYMDSIEEDVLKFNIKQQKQSGSNRKAKLGAIKKLLEYKHIDLGESFWKDVKANGKKAYGQTETEAPTRQQLKNILKRGNSEAKAMFLTQMTSNSRIDSIRKLEFQNLHLETDPPTIYIPPEDEKNGKGITKFISYEAKKWIEEYLEKDRKRILKTRLNRARSQKVKEKYKNRVFPMGKSNTILMWRKLIIKEFGDYKIDPKTKHPIMGTHSLRCYFEDNIGNSKLATYLANKVPKRTKPYQYRTKHKLDNEYKKYMKNLLVLEEPIEDNPKFIENKQAAEKYKQTIEEKDKIINKLQKRENIITMNTEAKEQKLNDFDNRIKNLEKLTNIEQKLLNNNSILIHMFNSIFEAYGNQLNIPNKKIREIKSKIQPKDFKKYNIKINKISKEENKTNFETALKYAKEQNLPHETKKRIYKKLTKYVRIN